MACRLTAMRLASTTGPLLSGRSLDPCFDHFEKVRWDSQSEPRGLVFCSCSGLCKPANRCWRQKFWNVKFPRQVRCLETRLSLLFHLTAFSTSHVSSKFVRQRLEFSLQQKNSSCCCNLPSLWQKARFLSECFVDASELIAWISRSVTTLGVWPWEIGLSWPAGCPLVQYLYSKRQVYYFDVFARSVFG